jgi:hypothetical protein
MIHPRATALICLLAFAPGLALGQSQDPAAERARLGNERIEAERRAREELEQQNRAPQPAAQPAGQPTALSAPRTQPQGEAPPPGPRRPPTEADRTERGLQQLRELGKLKDAGYLTDAEFQRIKQQILDIHF